MNEILLLTRRSAILAVLSASTLGAIAIPAGWAIAASTSSHVITAHASRKVAQFGVTSTRPGWTHIENSGSNPFIVRRGSGGSVAALVSDYNHKRFTQAARRFPIATTVDPDADAYVRLERGRYFVLAGYHTGSWQVRQVGVLTVSGSTVDSPLPRANAVTLDKHYDVHSASTLRRLPYAKLVDRSSHSVNIEAIEIGRTTSDAAVRRFLAHPSLRKLGTLSAKPTATLAQTCAPQATIYNPEYLRKGREMLISFRDFDSKLHRGQARLITVR